MKLAFFCCEDAKAEMAVTSSTGRCYHLDSARRPQLAHQRFQIASVNTRTGTNASHIFQLLHFYNVVDPLKGSGHTLGTAV